jgi:hypothetical protein
MQTDYQTNDPIIFTICVVLIFAFTSAVFVVYDRLVEKRQKTVMTSAAHTSAIVSSLFPSTVRDRLFEADKDAFSNEKTFQNESFVSFGDKVVSRPIADLYPSATVMFADMYVMFSSYLFSQNGNCAYNRSDDLRPLVRDSQRGVQAAILRWSFICSKVYTVHLTRSLTHSKFSKSKQLETAVSTARENTRSFHGDHV